MCQIENMAESGLLKRVCLWVVRLIGKVLFVLILSQLCYSSLPVVAKWSCKVTNRGVEKVVSWKDDSVGLCALHFM